MGNCTPKKQRDSSKSASMARFSLRLSGPESSVATSWIRIALLHKNVALHFTPAADAFTAEWGAETVAGTGEEEMLGYVREKVLGAETWREWTGLRGAGMMAAAQHRSVVRHLERLAEWVEEMAAGRRAAMGSPRMEMRRLGRCYSQLVEVLLEHAQMEERVVFPVLDAADRGLCKAVKEEHARDLPIMNGIKEDIKSIIVLDSDKYPIYQEALLNLSARLNILLENCREHFEEEERDVLPLLDAAAMIGKDDREEEVVEEEEAEEQGKGGGLKMERMVVEVMEQTHSPHLFHVLIAGLHPHEAVQYLDLLRRCLHRDRAAKMFRSLASRMENASSSSSPPMLCNLLSSGRHQ